VTALWVKDGGCVGVGTTTPVKLLDVAGDARVQGALTVEDLGDAYTFPSGDGDLGETVVTDGGGVLSFGNLNRIADGDGDTKIQAEKSSDEDALRFDTAGSEKMVLTSAGRIGLGVTSPNFLLDASGDGVEATILLTSHYSGVNSGALGIQKARGTKQSPAGLQWDDNLGVIVFKGYDGYNFNSGGHIRCKVDGEPRTCGDETDMPSRFEFCTAPDGSNEVVTRLWIKNDGQIRLGNPSVPSDKDEYSEAHLYDQSGAHLDSGGQWINASRRAYKRSIVDVISTGSITLVEASDQVSSVTRTRRGAWDLLDLLHPVDYEYKKQVLRVQMKDGRLLTEEEAYGEIQGNNYDEVVDTITVLDPVTGKSEDIAITTRRPMELEDVADGIIAVWIPEGSGNVHRGFIADEVPPELSDGSGISALDIAANNTAALKEAKRRIERLEYSSPDQQIADLRRAISGYEDRLSTIEQSTAPVTISSLSPEQVAPADERELSDEELLKIVDAVFEKMGLETWIEIPFDQA